MPFSERLDVAKIPLSSAQGNTAVTILSDGATVHPRSSVADPSATTGLLRVPIPSIVIST
jgi:hypothetical protein